VAVTCGQGDVDPLLETPSQRLVDVPGEVGRGEDHHHLGGVVVIQSSPHAWSPKHTHHDSTSLDHSYFFLILCFFCASPVAVSVRLTVHLDQKLGFDPAAGLVLVGRPPAAADGVDLVYEDGRRCVEAGLRKGSGSGGPVLCGATEPGDRPLTISNSRRTSFSDSPLYLEVRVEEDTLKKVVPHSVATALANMVLPVPGGPTINTPWNTHRRSADSSGEGRTATGIT